LKNASFPSAAAHHHPLLPAATAAEILTAAAAAAVSEKGKDFLPVKEPFVIVYKKRLEGGGELCLKVQSVVWS